MQIHDYITRDGDNGYLSVKIVPNASKNQIVGPLGEHLKIRIAAIPENNKANKQLISFLAQELQIKKHQIEIISGASSRVKMVRVNF